MNIETLIILYVADQEESAQFYKVVLGTEPCLHVPGMTEFQLTDGCRLGLMPEASIKKLMGNKFPDPSKASGIPRAELYLSVENAQLYHDRAIANGAIELSGLQKRPWGGSVAYSIDPDGHVLAFCEVARND